MGITRYGSLFCQQMLTCRALVKPPFKWCVQVQLLSALLGEQIACVMWWLQLSESQLR